MRRYLTEPEAWRAIAEKLLNQGRIDTGLCAELTDSYLDGVIADGIYKEMKDRLREHLTEARYAGLVFGGYVYGDKDTGHFGHGKYHEERALACLWMALEAEEEGIMDLLQVPVTH